jgi:hypothetical protein
MAASREKDEHTPVVMTRKGLLEKIHTWRMALRAHKLRAEYWRNRALKAEAALDELGVEVE